ncbi:MAG: hypothetical protein HRT36_04660 [Alphaproteobacteria bacterium]|nr:hypothetical protein [Alphaproteobacteria bacterium]
MDRWFAGRVYFIGAEYGLPDMMCFPWTTVVRMARSRVECLSSRRALAGCGAARP